MDSNKWKTLVTSNTPPPRCFHSCITLGDEMFIFGGINYEKNETLNDLYKFSNNSWTKLNYGTSQGISKVLFGNTQESKSRFAGNILYYDSKFIFFNGGNLKNLNLELEYIEDEELKPKSISAKKKMEIIFSQNSILQKFQQFAQLESNEDFITLKKYFIEFKKPKSNRKQISEEIMKLIQNISVSSKILEYLSKDISTDLENSDLFSNLEIEIDYYLIGMIHRFSFSDIGYNSFDPASQRVNIKKSFLKNLIHSDLPENLNQNFLFKTYHKIGMWLFSFGGINFQNFQKFTLKDCTKEEDF